MMKKHLLIFISLCIASVAYAGACVSWPSGDFQPQPDSLGRIAPSTGIYWFNTNAENQDSSETVMPACHSDNPQQKAVCLAKLKKSGYFDPSKPTILFIHGWQPGATVNKQRFDFCYQYPVSSTENSPIYNTLHYWKGWNVGVFYWTQFADEDNMLDAEAKIYSNHGAQGMRWAYLDEQGQLQHCQAGSLHCKMPLRYDGQVADVLQMLERAYRQALPAHMNASQLRIAGQSLGTQLAIQLTRYVLNHPQLPQPTRLSLMDPYISPTAIETKNESMPTSIAAYNTTAVDDIEHIRHHMFPIDVYRTSRLSYFPTGNAANQLMSKVAYMSLYPHYFEKNVPYLQKEGLLHISSIYLYFESMKAAPVYVSGDFANAYVNAASQNNDVLKLMQQQRYQVQSPAESHFPDTRLDRFDNIKPTPATLLPQDPLTAILALNQIYDNKR